MALTHWIEEGEGRPLVLIHGLGGDAGFWSEEIEALRGELRLIAVDLRGCGATPPAPPPFTIEELAEDIVTVLDACGLQTASVLGFSLGGLVAQALAAAHPERVDRLVLASTYAFMNPQARMFLDAVRDVLAGGASSRQMFGLVCPWLFSAAFIADPANRPYLADAEVTDEPPEPWLAMYEAQRAFDGRSRLGEIAAETLVIHGTQDALVPLADAEALAAGIPAARLRLIGGAGHLTSVEAPERFRAELRDYLAG